MTDMIVIEEAVGEIGCEPYSRTVDELLSFAVVNIDKQAGPTSHQVSDYVQKILGLKKARHSGTLDPMVTGVQPVAIGRATKVVQYLLKSPKEYICIMHLHKDNIEHEEIRKVMAGFIGKIQQLPPVRSAVKRQLRTREIYELEILEIDNRDVLFRVLCEAGTYIRKLCTDIGKKMNIGAQMQELRRSQAGPFREEDHLVTCDDLRDALFYYKEHGDETYLRHCLWPIERAVRDFKKIYVFDSALESLSHGRDLGAPGISKMENFKLGEIVAVMSLKGELVCVGEALMSAVQISTEKKGLAVATSKVFMEAIAASVDKEDSESVEKREK